MKHPLNMAMLRELREETNNIITEELLRDGNDKVKNIDYFHNLKAKYYFIAVEIKNNIYDDTSIFGDVEEHDNIERVVRWYKKDDELYKKFNFRIKGDKKFRDFYYGMREEKQITIEKEKVEMKQVITEGEKEEEKYK